MKTFHKSFIQAVALAGALVLPSATFANKASTVIDDAAITAAIKAKQASQPLGSPFKVNVQVHNGNVKLRGLVKTNAQYETAVMQAASIQNVQDVDANELKVQKSSQPITDTMITALIKGKFLQAQFFDSAAVDAWGVTVETKNGEVFLVGEVDAKAKKYDMVKIAHQVRNVKKVNATGLKVVASE